MKGWNVMGEIKAGGGWLKSEGIIKRERRWGGMDEQQE